MSRAVAIALVLLIILGGVGLYLQREHPQPVFSSPATLQQKLPTSMAPQIIQRDEPVPSTPGAAHIAVPGMLDGSDDMTRSAAYQLSPTLAKWLAPEQQLRKWVALIDAVADGKLPEKNQPLKYPMQGFSVTLTDGAVYANTANYVRTNLLVETVTAIPPQKLADYYHAWSRLLERANSELGRRGSFDSRLHLAIQNVVDVKPLPEDAKLIRPQFYYTYADPALEHSSAVAKLLWRMGPANQHQVQSYLSDLLPLL